MKKSKDDFIKAQNKLTLFLKKVTYSYDLTREDVRLLLTSKLLDMAKVDVFFKAN